MDPNVTLMHIEHNNDKCYILAFKYYINIDIANPNYIKYDFINFNFKTKNPQNN